MSNYLILACDGGGMRGYLSSLLMQRLDQDLGIFGANNQNIDLYAGTSTGGLIALGLASGQSVDKLVSVYKNDGADIFATLAIQRPCIVSEAEKLKDFGIDDLKELWQVLFDDIGVPSSVRTVVESFIPGNPLLSSLANKVMVATFQLGAPAPSWTPLIIDNFAGSPGAATYVYDAALSTSAAPVYFPPYQHPVFGWCSDGGLFANNPAPQAVARAVETGQSLPNIALLSIGTGFTNASLPVTAANRLCYGLKNWVWFETDGPTPPFPLLNGIMDGVSATNDYLCGQLLGGNYKRVNPTLPYSVALDDYTPATMAMFEETASNYFETEEWTAIEKWVKNIFQK